jgi:chorismate lyase/3-hydroxybenzoate synthase
VAAFETAPALRVEHVQADARALLQAPDVLAVLGAELGLPALHAANNADGARDPRTFDLGLAPLVDAANPWRQVVRGQRTVERVLVDGQPVATDGDYLFSTLAIDATMPLAAATREAYAGLLQRVHAAGFPHLVRIWNYLPDINGGGEGDAEHYRQFCLGRFEAFTQVGRAPSYPAASALGLHGGSARVAVLAARIPAVPVENPKQVSAFRYPRQYGPASPSFSRASMLATAAGKLLLVSGTAAITGHESMHIGDAAAQLRASIANIGIVVAAAEGPRNVFGATPDAMAADEMVADEMAADAAPMPAPPQAQFRVYLRSAQDLPAVRAAFAESVRIPCSVEWLQADVCRRELLVEVEAALSWPLSRPDGG